MVRKERALMFVSLLLVFFAVVACVAPTIFVRRNIDIQDGLVGWKCTVNGITDQEIKYGYDEDGELISIEFFQKGKPVFYSSYFEYLTIENEEGLEVKYRCLSKRAYFLTSTSAKQWEETITAEVINGEPKIVSIVTETGAGVLRYKDEYEYDEQGRKIKAKRSWKNGNTTEYEYFYEEGMNPGIEPKSVYFEIPVAFYDGNHYINWCTLVTEEIPVSSLK